MDKLYNPHDKLFRETWSNKELAQDYLENHLPASILDLVDLNSLEISKDSFIEKELENYYSDLLYKIKLGNNSGYIYFLFEHKSSPDRLIYLQLLEYMLKIWRLHLKQTKKSRLPIIIPLVLYHGRKKWSVGNKFSNIIQGPTDKLIDFIPDFEIILNDLTAFSDNDIKGKVLSRVVMLLLKHVFDPDYSSKLSGILSLMQDLFEQDTGLQYLEKLFRYVVNTAENITVDEVKTIIKQSVSEGKEDLMATIAEQLRNEGFQKGMHKGIIEGMDLAITLKFGTTPESKKLLDIIHNVKDIELLQSVKKAIIDAKNIPELIDILNQ